jgi:hypothetical protein
MPVGPGERVGDTLESVRAYLDPSHAVVLVDDTGGAGLSRELGAGPDPRVRVVPAPAGARGNRGGLWVKIAAGYRHVLRTLEPELILRMDADALLIGPGIEDAAQARFAERAGLGLLGSYRTGPDGGLRDFSSAVGILRAECGVRGLRRPRLRSRLRRLVATASDAGYELGEHALGGAFVHSAAAARGLEAAGYLDMPEIGASGLGEDHVFGLITRAAGWSIGDFGGPGDAMALRWIGLPAHPDELLARGALITHSVRSYGDLDEDGIRAAFARARRAEDAGGTS